MGDSSTVMPATHFSPWAITLHRSPPSAVSMAPCTLPPELGLLVIDHLGSEEDEHPGDLWLEDAEHVHALRQCALTCRDWLHRSRLNLYRAIYLESRRGIRAARATLERYPAMRAAVRVLRVQNVSGSLPFWDVVLFMRTMLVPHVRVFHLRLFRESNFRLANVARACLQMRFETVSCLTLRNVDAWRVWYILRAFPALRCLQCYFIDVRDSLKHFVMPNQVPWSIQCGKLEELKVCGHTACQPCARSGTDFSVV